MPPRGRIPARGSPPHAQIQPSAYDFEANLAILKLYQFYPQTTNMEVVAKILAKARMATGTDFLLCTYLISEQIKVDTVVEALEQQQLDLQVLQQHK